MTPPTGYNAIIIPTITSPKSYFNDSSGKKFNGNKYVVY
jgi:hypothetical protein